MFRASPQGERAPAPVRPPQRDRHAPLRKGSVHLRRSAHHSVTGMRLSARRACTCAGPPTTASPACASPQGERAPAPVRPPQRHRHAPLRKESVHLRRSAHHSVTGMRLSARRACTCAGPPIRACAGARLSARGVCDPRREALRRASRCTRAKGELRPTRTASGPSWSRLRKALHLERQPEGRVCLRYRSPSPASSLGEPALISARRCSAPLTTPPQPGRM